MRVISGSAKGHNLKCISGTNTRPTTGKVKESIFNIIASCITDSTVLDLFSGTGSLAIEALSRGACFGVLIDNNPACIKVINENLLHTKLKDKAKVILGDVSQIKNLKEKFDIIFMDAPYNKDYIIPVLCNIKCYGLLNVDGLIVIERSKKDIIENIPFVIVREQSYGDTVVSFLKNSDS